MQFVSENREQEGIRAEEHEFELAGKEEPALGGMHYARLLASRSFEPTTYQSEACPILTCAASALNITNMYKSSLGYMKVCSARPDQLSRRQRDLTHS